MKGLKWAVHMHSTPDPVGGLLEAALDYRLTLDWPVFPVCSPLMPPHQHRDRNGKLKACDAPGKTPLVTWKAYQHILPTERVIRGWWSTWPAANVGLATGSLSGVVVIDLDGAAALEYAAEQGYELGPWASTGKPGGRHVYCAYRDDAPGNFAKINGVDFRGQGGFVVLPGSRHRNGTVYLWGEAPLPGQVFPSLPYWIDALSKQRTQHGDVEGEPLDVEWLLEHGFDEGGRDDGIFRVAAKLRGQDVPIEEAYVICERIAAVCRPPFDDAAAKVDSVYERYPANPRITLTGKHKTAAPPGAPPLREGGGGATSQDPLRGPADWMPAHTIREERERPQEVVEWLIEGWLGKGMMTEVVGKVKMGKTTFAMRGLQAGIDGDADYCGQTITRPFRALYITEEGRATFHEALQRYGLWDLEDELVVVYDFEMLTMPLDKAVSGMIWHAEQYQVDVVVIDTLTTVAGLDDEDNSARVGAAMREFRRIANAGYAVWVLRHGRKAGGEVGDAGRGSSAISGAVDILLQIDPARGEDDESNLRTLRAKGRMKATPTKALMLAFDQESERYSLVGEAQSKEERLSVRVLTGLHDLNAYDLESGQKSGDVAAKIGRRDQAVRTELKALVDDGRVRSSKRLEDGHWIVVYWLPPVIHLGGDKPDEPAEPQGPLRDPEPETGTAPPPPTLKEAQSGRRKDRTPEQQAKAAAAKAERELAKLEAADLAAPRIEYRYVRHDGDLYLRLGELLGTVISLDTETTGLSAKRDRLRTVQVSDGRTHLVIDAWAIEDWSPLQKVLDRASEIRMHTYLFDLAFLQQVGITVKPERIFDVRTAAVCLEAAEDWVDYRLQGIAKRHLAQHVNKAEQKRGWEVATLRHAKLAYAAEDARVTFAAADALQTAIGNDPNLDDLSSVLMLEQQVQEATWWLASAGAPCDVDVMRQAVAEQESEVATRLEALRFFGDVKWTSWQQVLPILQARGLDVVSTGEDALMDAESDDPIIDALLGYRSARACLGLLKKAQASIAPDGRIYASFNPIGAQTGRTSCSDPNLQNLPHETLARAAIRPPAGRVFVRADYSQLQLCIAAWIAQDRIMLLELNEPDGDVHQRTADAVGCSRQQAKAVNFGFLFGAGVDTFRREQRKNGVILSERQAAEYRKTFMRTYRGIRSWHRSLGEWGNETVVQDPSGSGRRRKAIFSNNVKANTPVQMVEAHGFKRALAELYQHRDEAPTARLVMMVHDELIAEVDERYAAETQAWLTRHMINGMQPLVDGVQIRVEAKVTVSYSDADKK